MRFGGVKEIASGTWTGNCVQIWSWKPKNNGRPAFRRNMLATRPNAPLETRLW